jgi:hypothetical protein
MTAPPEDVAAAFGSSRRVAVAVVVIIAGANLALVLLDPADGIPRQGAWVTWALTAVGASALFFPRGDPLVLPWAGVVLAAAVLAASAVLWDPPSETSGYAPWYIRSATILLVVLILRGRPAAGWIGAALMTVVVMGWVVTSGEEIGPWIGVLARQLVTFVPIQIMALGLAWAARTVAAYRAEERHRVRSEELRSASLRERRREVARIRSLSAPILERIAEGEDDAALRAEATRVEASLRDVLRGRRLAAEPLATAVRAARERGVDVSLLDDLGETGPSAEEFSGERREAALEWAADLVERSVGDTATIRLAHTPEGPAVTVFSGSGDVISRPV